MNSRPLILLLLLLLPTLPAAAGVNRWTPWGPGGGTIRALAIDPSDPDLVFAVAEGGVYRSADAGVSWSWVAGAGSCCAGAVAVDPARPWRVLAGGRGTLKFSEDRGRTWTEILNGDGLYAEQIVFAGRPAVFLVQNSRLFWSHDGGRTWAANPLERDGVRGIAVDPRRPERVYAILLDGLWESLDGGLTWSGARDPDRFFPPPGPPGSYDFGVDVAVAPSRPETVYVTKDLAFYRSVDAGRSWKRFPPVVNPDLSRAGRLAVDPRVPSTVYAATSVGVRVSRDGGATWSPLNSGLPLDAEGRLEIGGIAIDPAWPEILYAGVAAANGEGVVQDLGIAKSSNGGRRWSLGTQRGLSAARFGLVRAGERGVYFVTLNPIDLNFSFARAFRSGDGGQTWTPVAQAIAGQGIADLEVDPSAPGVVYAATREGVWKSRDGGTRWQRLLRRDTSELATAGSGVVLAGSCGLWRSADGGQTWTQTLPCRSTGAISGYLIRRLQVAPSRPREIYADVAEILSAEGNSRQAVYRSQDGGATWSRIADGGLVTTAPSQPETLYVQTLVPEGLELLRSDDRGETWRVAGRLDLPLADLAVDPRNPEVLYGAVQQHGVQRSRDGGRTWETVNAGLARMDRLDVRVLTPDPWQPDRYFVLPWTGGGLFVASFPD